MNKVLMLAGALAVAAAPAFAHTKDSEAKAQHWFQKMDTDGNGSISKSEHDAFSQQKFTKADANKDGSISMQEFTEHKRMEKDDVKDQSGSRKDMRDDAN